ncbi:hypothetical protein D3C87_2050730 [compost metagenome]
MGTYYRLRELGFRLPAGAHVIKRSALEPIEAVQALVQDAKGMPPTSLQGPKPLSRPRNSAAFAKAWPWRASRRRRGSSTRA